MNHDELRDQLERRTTAAPLASTERVELIEAVHARTSKRRGGVSLWVGRLAIPLAAAATVVVFVVVVGFPRAPQTSSTSPTPGGTPAPSSTATPSATASASASASPQSGLAVLSTDQLVALAGDSSKVGQVVVSDAVISFVPSPTRFDVPDASPQAFGTIEAGGGSVVVIGQSFPDTSWPDHAFRVVEGGRVEYLGPVNDNTDTGIWTVPDAIATAPPEADNVLYAVQGWLLQTAAAPCVAPPDFSSSQDYWCGGSWLLPDKPVPPTDGTIHLQYPDSLHVQWSAYQDFAENPQSSGVNGGEPRLGTYLVQPAGCPPNVMGDCPVWEMVGRVSPAMTGVVEMPTAEPTASATKPATPSPSGTPLALETDPPSIPGNGCMLALLLPVRMAHTGDHVQFLWAAGGNSDGTEARIVWPAGFSAWLVNGRAELRDPVGGVLAVDGDVLDNLGGGDMGDDRIHVCSIGDRVF